MVGKRREAPSRTATKRPVVHCILGLAAALLIVAAGWTPFARADGVCCAITAIDHNAGVVTAKETATGRTFQFKVPEQRLLASLKVGQPVYANYSARQVSLDGRTACCSILSGAAVGSPPAIAPGALAVPKIQPGQGSFAQGGAGAKSPDKEVSPGGTALTLNPASVKGGDATTGIIRLDTHSIRPGSVVRLSSSSDVASMPATVPSALGPQAFTVKTKAVDFDVPVTVIASWEGGTTTARLTVIGRCGAQPVQPTLLSLTLESTSGKMSPPIVATGGAIGTVHLSGPVPVPARPCQGTSLKISLMSTDPRLAAVPASIAVPPGASSATFDVATTPNPQYQSAAPVNAIPPGVSCEPATATLRQIPLRQAIVATVEGQAAMCARLLVVAPPELKSFVIRSSDVVCHGNGCFLAYGTTYPAGGYPSQLSVRVNLSSLAPAPGIQITLFNGNHSATTVPATVIVEPGNDEVEFRLTPNLVERATLVNLSATLNGLTKPLLVSYSGDPGGPFQQIWVMPPSEYPFSVALSSKSVTGGTDASGNMTLHGLNYTGQGGSTKCSYSTNNTAIVPNSPAAIDFSSLPHWSENFLIPTRKVQASTHVAITFVCTNSSPVLQQNIKILDMEILP